MDDPIKLREDGNFAIIENITEYVNKCHGAAIEAGWHNHPKTGERLQRDFGVSISLIHSELSEALEGDRKGLMDDHLPDRIMAEVELADAIIRACDTACYEEFDLAEWESDINRPRIKSVFATDLAVAHAWFSMAYLNFCCDDFQTCMIYYLSAINQICAMADEYGFNLVKVIDMKMAYNKTRLDHKPEERVKEGGKGY